MKLSRSKGVVARTLSQGITSVTAKKKTEGKTKKKEKKNNEIDAKNKIIQIIF